MLDITTKFSATQATTSSHHQIWALWRDAERWGEWDGGLRSARLNGPFTTGTTGSLQPRTGPPSQFVIVDVRADGYTFETKLPLAVLRVVRQFEVGDPVRFTHTVSFHGPLRHLWAAILGSGFQKELPHTLRRLAALAEQSP
jgi:hypothetical protein